MVSTHQNIQPLQAVVFVILLVALLLMVFLTSLPKSDSKALAPATAEVISSFSGTRNGTCDWPSSETWGKRRLRSLALEHSRFACNVLSAIPWRSWQSDNHAVKLFLFQKDETETLADWLQYHSYLFGISNIHVIDNMSKDPNICKLLALYRQCGLKITPHTTKFEFKHRTISEAMRNNRNKFLVPLDGDEFIVHMSPRNGGKLNVRTDRATILHEFHTLPIDGRKYKFEHVLDLKYNKKDCLQSYLSANASVPERRMLRLGRLGSEQYPLPHTKTFYYSDGFLQTDQGNHFGFVTHDAEDHLLPEHADLAHIAQHYVISNVSLLHANVSSFASLRSRYTRGAAAYNYSASTNCSEVKSGIHYCFGAKLVQQPSSEGMKWYLELCAPSRINHIGSNGALVTWLKKNALDMQSIVGVD